MKVIRTPEENKPKVEWTKQCNCPMCNATIEYTNLDIEYKQGRYNELEIGVRCGYCNKWFCI